MSKRKNMWKKLIALLLVFTLSVPSVYIPAKAEETSLVTEEITEETSVESEEKNTEETYPEEETDEEVNTEDTDSADDSDQADNENLEGDSMEDGQEGETAEQDVAEEAEAQETSKDQNSQQSVTSNEGELQAPETEEDYTILAEVEEEREETSKTFLLDDGSFMVAQYGIPVHYEDANGEWQDIDTALVSEIDAEEPDEVYSTTEKAGKKETISFSKKLKEGKTVRIKDENFKISWGLSGAEKKNGVIVTSEGEETLSGNNKFLAQTGLSQKIIYEDVFEDVDVEYILFPAGIKENLILKEPGTQHVFETLYNIDKLTPVQKDEQTIQLMDGEEVVYEIQAPYMADASGARSTEVALAYETVENKKILVRMTVDEVWLKDEARQFPVTVDPIILTESKRSDIDTTFITEDRPGVNYSGGLDLLVGKESSEYGDCRTLVKFALPELNPGDMVVDADLKLYNYHREFYSSGTPDLQINAHQITESWTLTGVTWNNRPEYDLNVLDYNYIRRSENMLWKNFDITSAVKGWYEGTASNYGIILKSYNEGGSYADVGVKGYFWPERYNDVSDAYPMIQITYRNNKGLEDYWSYTTLGAGTAGTAYINDYSGNLVFVHEDVSTTGELLPVTLQHVYNGYMAATKYMDSYPTDGRGWRLSIQRTLKSSSNYGLTGESLETFPYAYEDGDGTVHFFYKKTENGTTKYLDEDGLGLELTISGTTKTIKDKDGNSMTFGAKGNLTVIGDAYGNEIRLTYTTASDDTSQITKVTDGAGHVISFTESTNGYHQLRKVTDPSGRVTEYTFNSGGYVTRITYPDGNYSLYEYDSDGAMTRAVSSDGSGLQFTYTSKVKGKRVKKVVEFGNDSVRNSDGTIASTGRSGQTLTFDRSKYNTTVIRTSGLDDAFNTNDDMLTTYQFDDFGRTVSTSAKTVDGVSYGGDVYTYTAGKVNDSGSNIKKLNRVADGAYSSKNQRNYLKNHSAEMAGDWSATYWNKSSSQYEAERVVEQAYFGNYSFRIIGKDVPENGGGAYFQAFSTEKLRPGDTYTFSGYVKTSEVAAANNLGFDYGACLAVRYAFAEKDYERVYSDYVTGTTSTSFGNGWTRISLTFTVPEDATGTRAYVLLRNATGTAYFDGLQIEYGSSMNPYNMFENAGFEEVTGGMPDSWESVNLGNSDKVSTTYYHAGETSMKITGEAAKDKYIYQQVTVGGTEKDIYVVSAWARAEAVKNKSGVSRPFDIYAKIYYSDNTSVVKTKKAEFNRDVSGWQKASMAFDLDDGDNATTRKPTQISIRLRYDNQVNTAYFDQAQLVKDVAGSYTYDSEGNIITASANGEQNTALSYDDNSDLTSVTDAENQTYKYEYNDSHQVIKATSPTGMELLFNYNGKGPLVFSTISNSNGSMQIKTGKTYNVAEDGIAAYTYVVKEGDQNAYQTVYDYDVQSGNVLSVTTPNGAQTDYTYEEQSNLLTAVTSGETSVVYDYDTSNTKLSSITHNGFDYSFGYDVFGNATTTQIAGTTISTNTYASGNGKLKSVTYGNGLTKSYTYNKAGSVTAEKIGSTKAHSWGYDSSQTPLWYKDHVSGQKHTYEYDITGRIIGAKITSMTDDSALFASKYGYTNLDQLKKQEVTAGGRTYTTSYSYNENHQPSETSFSSSRAITWGYDSLGRMNSKTVSTDIPLTYHYLYWNSQRNGDSETKTYKTTQIAREVIGKNGYHYTYDNMGNIILIQKGTKSDEESASATDMEGLTPVVSYEYDNKNQLIRENNKELGENGKTILYSYDAGGNLTSRKEYAYTEGEVSGDPVVLEYKYESQNGWKDQLTKYNGLEIKYDSIGNPTEYLGKELDWEGRSLISLTDSELNVSYRYNADGLRTGKTVGSIESDYYYVDGQLAYEKRGDKELYFTYDTAGILSRIIYYNNDTLVGNYYVAVNSRGDVDALYNAAGVAKVNYTYDTWGNVISIVNENGQEITSESNIGLVNPIRYRGYYYDAETGFYYVSSRYYDPEIGRFLNADGYISTDTGVLGYNMFAYCNNNPVVYKDPNGQSIVAALIVGGALLFGYIYVSTTSNNNNQENNNTSNIKQSKTKPNFVPNPNKRKGSDKRQPTGERQRNVGHPNGEEHSRVPKGNRGIRRIEALAGVVLTSVAITVIAIDDFTLVGVSNDVALAPTTVIWWDYASVLMN